jgi:cytochrome c
MLQKNPATTLGSALTGCALLLLGLTVAAPSKAQLPENGKALFERRCGGCHALERDKEGPRLGGVYKRRAGAVASFQYSDALKKSRIVWTDALLDRWLTDTEKVVANNEMSFQVENGDERHAIISYLKQSSGK